MTSLRVVEIRDEEAGLSFSVSPESGGELSSLRVRRGGRWLELLHRANLFTPARKAWRGRAPWLFPAVGRSAHGERPGVWGHQGKTLPMAIHGFVMDRPWTLVSCDRRSAVCRTESDPSTRKAYPFAFELTVVYALLPDGVSVRAEVSAAPSNRAPMPFCLGNHLTLALPFGGAGAAEDLSIRTPARECLLLDDRGLLSGQSVPASYGEGCALRADSRLSDRVLAGFEPGECWVELRGPSGLGLRVAQTVESDPGALRFVLYSDPARTFFCPEPWHGEPNSLNTGRALKLLAPGERFEWEMVISVF